NVMMNAMMNAMKRARPRGHTEMTATVSASPQATHERGASTNYILLNPGNGKLHLRFPYSPEIVRLINEQLTQCLFVEGTTDSAIRTDGVPPPAASKPMLYSVSGEAAENLPVF